MEHGSITSSDMVFTGRVFGVRLDTVQMSSGQTVVREIVTHRGAAAVVALDEADNVVLVRQHRAAARQVLLEIPAGGLEPGEPPIDCARRELQEEVGLYPEELVELGQYWVAGGYNEERIVIFLARGLRPSPLPGDEDEFIEVQRIPFAEALDQVFSNEIVDSKTLIGLVWAARHLNRLG